MRVSDLLDGAGSSRHGSGSGVAAEAPPPRTSAELTRSSGDTSTTASQHIPPHPHGGASTAPLGKLAHRLSILSDGSADVSLKHGGLGGDASHHLPSDAYRESDVGGGSSHHGRNGASLLHANSSSLHGGAGSGRANPWKKVNSAVKINTALGVSRNNRVTVSRQA